MASPLISTLQAPPVQPVVRVRADNSIGFLRIVLAALVIYTHAYYLGGFGEEPLMRWTNGGLTAGTLAVQSFFVLSGWLVASSWLRLNSLVVFLWHRFLRIGPGFWVCLIVTAAVIGPLIHFTWGSASGNYLSLEPGPAGYVLRNFLQPRAQIAIGDLALANPHPRDLNGSLWTLFYEAACYLAVGACGLTMLSRKTGRIIWVSVLGCLLLLHPLARAGLAPASLLRLFDTPGKIMSWHFATGMTCAVFPPVREWFGRTPWPALAGFAALIVAWGTGNGPVVSPLALPPVLFWLAENFPVRNWEKLVGGDFSYGLYVYGYPLQQLLAHWHAQQLGLAGYTLLSLLTAGGFAWLSWHTVEAPALRWRHAFGPKKN